MVVVLPWDDPVCVTAPIILLVVAYAEPVLNGLETGYIEGEDIT